MDESRRQFLQDMTTLGALGGATAVFGAKESDAREPSRLAQAQPSATPNPMPHSLPCRAYT
jgi:hypothetical protein